MNMQQPSRMLPSVLDTALELHDAAGLNDALEAEYEAIRAETNEIMDVPARARARRCETNEALEILTLETLA